MAADGTITIDTDIDSKGIKVGIREIEASAKRMTSTVSNVGEKAKISIQKQVDSLTKLNNQYTQQEKKVDLLKQKLQELGQKKVETESFKNLGKESEVLLGKAAELEAELRKLSELGFSENDATFKRMEKELSQIAEKIEEVEEKQRKMKDSGTAYIDPKTLEEYRKKASELANEEQKLQDMNNRLKTSFASVELKMKEVEEEASKSEKKTGKFAETIKSFSDKRFKSGLDGIKNKISSIGRRLDSLIKKFLQLSSNAVLGGLKKLSSGIFSIHKTANKSTYSLGKMIATSLMMSSVFKAISAVTSGVGMGFQNLAQYSKRTNTSLSNLKSSLTQLKNALATAFAPILTVIEPILVRFINLLSQAFTYIGMFIAALTGQKTFIKAIGVQEDYAASLGNTADNAKKAEKALKGYLSPLDEVSRYETESGTDSGSSGYTAPSVSDMFEETAIESSIKGIAEKIKKLIQNEDWEGLGKYLAEEINKGMRYVYDAISWKKVGPKVESFVNAFVGTFNSMVRYLDFGLLGRVIGTGINSAVNTANLLLEGIDFRQIGRKISQGLRGAVQEIDWRNLGRLMGNYFMVAWNVLNGFVTDMSRKNDAGLTGWAQLGQALGKTVNGLADKVDFSTIAETITSGINGIFEMLDEFTITTDWDMLADKVTDGLNTAFKTMNWEEAGKSLDKFLGELVGFMVSVLSGTDWEEFGKGIGEFLSEIDWATYLWDMIIAIKDAIGGLFDGLEESGTAGKIAAFIGRAFLAVKIAKITGLDSLVKLLVGAIGKKLIGSESVATLAGSLEETLGKAAAEAAGGFKSLASSITPLVETAGLITAVGVAAVGTTVELAKMVEVMQDGNGIKETFGVTMDNFLRTLQGRGDIISSATEEIWSLKESLEKEGMTESEKVEATSQLIEKLGEMGVTSEQASRALEMLRQEGGITDDMLNILTQSISLLGTETTNMAGQVDLGTQNASDAYEDLKVAIGNLTNQMHLGIDEQGQLLFALERTVDAGGTAQDAYNAVMEAVQKMGGNTETAAKIFAEVFPEAVQATKKSVDENMVAAQETVSESTGQMKKDATENLSEVQKATEDASTASNDVTTEKWGDSSEEVQKNLRLMKNKVSKGMAEITATTRSHSTSQYNIFTSKWETAGKRTEQLLEELHDTVREKMNGVVASTQEAGIGMGSGLLNGLYSASNEITNVLNDIVSKVNRMISSINSSIGGIERSFTFSYNMQTPTGGNIRRSYWLNLPRVNSVPYLASGAVIPPQNEFLAVLGDQKRGNNIEAPESLLRKIVKEESGSTAGSYRFTAQLNRRTIFDEMIEEAKLRRDQNGFNPFLIP